MLAPAGRDDWGRPCLGLEGNEERIVALLSVAYDQPLSPRLLENLGKASRCWTRGELTLAYIHIAFAGLQPLEDPDAPRRLFMAAGQLEQGMDGAEMLKGLDLLPRYFTPWSWKQLVKDFNPDQPRDDHGRWSSEGGGAAPSGLNDNQVDAFERHGPGEPELTATQLAVIHANSGVVGGHSAGKGETKLQFGGG